MKVKGSGFVRLYVLCASYQQKAVPYGRCAELLRHCSVFFSERREQDSLSRYVSNEL